MTQMYCFFTVRTNGQFEIKFLSAKTLTEEQAMKWRDFYAKVISGDLRVMVTTEHHFPVQA